MLFHAVVFPFISLAYLLIVSHLHAAVSGTRVVNAHGAGPPPLDSGAPLPGPDDPRPPEWAGLSQAEEKHLQNAVENGFVSPERPKLVNALLTGGWAEGREWRARNARLHRKLGLHQRTGEAGGQPRRPGPLKRWRHRRHVERHRAIEETTRQQAQEAAQLRLTDSAGEAIDRHQRPIPQPKVEQPEPEPERHLTLAERRRAAESQRSTPRGHQQAADGQRATTPSQRNEVGGLLHAVESPGKTAAGQREPAADERSSLKLLARPSPVPEEAGARRSGQAVDNARQEAVDRLTDSFRAASGGLRQAPLRRESGSHQQPPQPRPPQQQREDPASSRPRKKAPRTPHVTPMTSPQGTPTRRAGGASQGITMQEMLTPHRVGSGDMYAADDEFSTPTSKKAVTKDLDKAREKSLWDTDWLPPSMRIKGGFKGY